VFLRSKENINKNKENSEKELMKMYHLEQKIHTKELLEHLKSVKFKHLEQKKHQKSIIERSFV
jgi:hypothetical protein